MKRTYLPLLLASALLLSGCGSRDEARFDAFAEELRSRSDIVMTAEVRARGNGCAVCQDISFFIN